MKAPRQRGRSLRPILVLVASTALVLASVYLVHQRRTDARRAYLAARHQRAVATLAERVKSVLENQVRVVSQAVRAACRDAACLDRTAPDTELEDTLQSAFNLEIASKGGALSIDPAGPGCPPTKVRDTLRIGFCPVTGLPKETVNAAGKHRRSGVARVPSHASTDIVVCFALTPPQHEATRFCAHANLDDLLRPMVEDSALGDLDVLLVDPTGEIRFAHGPGLVHFSRWPRTEKAAPTPPPGATPGPTASTAWPSLRDLQQATVGTTVQAAGARLGMLSQPVRIDLAALTELEKILRVEPQTDGEGALGSDWALVAILPDDHLAREGGSLPSILVAAATFALLIALVSPPILKVWTMGVRDRLRPIDVQLLALSTVLIVGLATIGLLATSSYHALRRERDDRLMRSAQQTVEQLRDLTDHAQRDLRLFASARVRSSAEQARDDAFLECGRLTTCRSIPSTCAIDLSRCDRIHDVYVPLPDGFTFSNTALLVVLSDTAGNQREKWSTRDATPQVRMERFGAYRDVRDGNLAVLDASLASATFALNAQASPNTAEVLTLLSIPFDSPATDLSAGESTRRAAIAALDTHRIGADLPPDEDFAVIKRDGQVLLHSRPQRSLFENFLDECSQCAELHSLIYARRAETLDIEYHAREHRAAVAPLGATPYSVIVFRDKNVDQTTALEVFAVAAAGFLVATGLLALLASLFIGVRDQNAGTWIWPRRKGDFSYLGLVLANLVLVLVSARSLADAAPATAVATSLAAGILGLALLVIRVRRDGPECEISFRQHTLAWAVALGAAAIIVASASGFGIIVRVVWLALAFFLALMVPWRASRITLDERYQRATFVSAIVLVGALLSVLPAAALFRDSASLGIGRLDTLDDHERCAPCFDYSRRENGTCELHDGKSCATLGDAPVEDLGSLPAAWHAADDLSRAAIGLLTTSFVGTDTPPDRVDCAVSANSTDAATNPPAAVAVPIAPVPNPERATAIAHHAFPILNAEGTRTRHLSANASVTTWRRILAPMGGLGGIVAIAIVGWFGWAFVHLLARRIVGLGLPGASPEASPGQAPRDQLWLNPTAAEEDFLVASARKHARLMARPPLARLRGRWIDDRAGVVDLRAIRDVAQLKERALAARSAPSVVILHFEHRIDESAWNTARLELLELLLFASPRRDGIIVVLSEIDVLTYFSGRIDSPVDAASTENYVSAAELDRWLEVMDKLAKRPRNLRIPGQPLTPLLESTLSGECTASGRLAGVREEIQTYPPPASIDRDALIDVVGELADAHYRMLWSGCTDEERVVLHNLAHDGFVGPRAWHLAQRLQARGLLRWTPALRLMNESFRRFVLRRDVGALVRDWDLAEGPSAWRRLQVGLVATFITAGLILYLLRPDQLSGMLGFLAAIGGGATTLVQLLGIFRAGRADATTAPAPPRAS